MRRSLLVVALIGTTVLTPKPAEAGPVAALFAGITAAFTSVGTAIGLGTAAAAAFGAAATQAVIGLGISAIRSLLTSPAAVPSPSDRMVNYAQAISAQERVYGEVRKGGPLGFTGWKDKARHYAVLIAAHQTDGPQAHLLDEREVTIETDTGSPDYGEVLTDPIAGYGSIRPYTGGPGQAVDPVLDAKFDEVTAEFDFAGLSYAALTARRPPDDRFAQVYTESREWAYTPVWRGSNQIHDPRTDSAGYTNNLALCLAHELVHHWGFDVDWDEVAAEAEACDVLVTNGEGNSQRLWTCNGTLSDDMEFDQVQAQFIAAGDVFLFERADGKIGFRVGRWIEPTVTLTENDFEELTIEEGKEFGAANEFVVRYVEPSNGYRETPAGAWVVDPAGPATRNQSDAFLVDSHNQAARLEKRLARVAHARYRVSGTLRLVGYELVGQRFATFTHSQLGLSFPIEIGRLIRNGDRRTFALDARSTSAEDFAFVAASEEPDRPAYEKVASEDAVEVPTGLAGVAQATTGGTGEIRWSWPDQDTTYRQQLRYRESGDPDWTAVDAPSGQSFHLATGLNDGGAYEAQLRNRTAAYRYSAWDPAVPVTVTATANPTPPGNLTGLTATGGAGEVLIEWLAPNDPAYFAARIYRHDADDFGAATLVHTAYGAASAADDWTDTGLAAGTWYYWGVPINRSGVPGSTTGSVSAIVT